jgi:TIR domain/Clp amino terminal domain, pathogenicity island component
MPSAKLKALIGKLNSTTRMALEGAAGLCVARTHYYIEIEHLLLKLTESSSSDFPRIAGHFRVNVTRLTSELNRALDKLKSGNQRPPSFAPPFVQALSNAWLYASLDFDAPKIHSGFVLLAMLTDDEARRMLIAASPELQLINAEQLKKEFAVITFGSEENSLEETATPKQTPQPTALGSVTGGPHIFISYRRNDAPLYAQLLFKGLREEVPDVFIFRDLDTLQPGMEFAKAINETVAAADFVLAIIGKRWAGGSAKTGTRIQQPEDLVRLEIAAGFQHQKVVIPCLVGGAKMPSKKDLPPELHALLGRNAVTLSDASFSRDVSVLMSMLKAWRRDP